MENQYFLPFPTLFAFLLFLFMVLTLWRKTKSKPNLPPGPWKLPLIGSMHHLAGPSLLHHRVTELARKYGPIMHLQLGQVTNIFISSPEIAREVMKTHDLIFATRPSLVAVQLVTYNFTDIAFAPYGDYWRQIKKICTMELLTAKRVQLFAPIRQEEVSKVITDITSNVGSTINFTNVLTSLTYKILSRSTIGKILKGEEGFIRAVMDLTEEGAGFNLADFYPSIKLFRMFGSLKHKLKRIHQQVDKMMQNVIDDRRATKRESGVDDEERDIVDVLLRIQEQGDLQLPLTDDNIKAVIFDMFSAGSDSSAATTIWTMSELLKNPSVMEKAQAEVRQVFKKKGQVDEEGMEELHYLKAAVKETLRLHAPGPLVVPRECTENCVIAGYDIPAKSRINVNSWALGRDPEYWTEPERYSPERFLDGSIDHKGNNFTYLPFGSGRRLCPGILFGLTNIEFILANLLYYFDWKLPNGLQPEDLDMTEVFGSAARRKNDLLVIPFQYLPPAVN
ncbi:hypothetical protein JCGZ_01042 [Jatropha curcas]|uniref:Cytochrome P450 n=1 Tax=Jatropha curcas TaxID=180498 RepID=A0A067L470_JATCU|nr:cytochrome P450 71D9 [Jatropha curcas]KDP39285.1 hypothetical protein JCGZ_01042 [Jatropha curcas]